MAQWNKNTQEYLANGTSLFEVVMLADEDGNPLNSYGSAANIPIAAGELSGYSHINKFGYSTDVALQGAAYATIWDDSSLYSYIGTAGVASVASTNGDTGTVEVQGLDGNYAPVTETITIGSSGTTEFLRIFRVIQLTGTNAEDIEISVDGAVRAIIKAEAGQTLMAVYTVPAGKTAYLMKFQGSIDKSNGETKFRFMARPFGGVFNVKGQFGTAAGSPITYDYPVPLIFPEKTDLEVRASSGSTLGAGAIFDLILVDN